MIEKLTRWVCGTARIRVWGDTARFIRIMVRSGVSPLEMIPEEESLQVLIRAKQFKELHAVKLRTHTKIRLLKKSGVPFLLNRFFHRPGFAAGLFIGICLYAWLSGFYWCVEIAGEAPYSKTEILTAAKASGVFVGAKKEAVDLPVSAKRFVRDLPEIAWASFNSEGCTVTLDFLAGEKRKDGVDDTGAYDVVAKRDGLVQKIIAEEGSVLVQVGSAVKEGQVLVSGAAAITDPWDRTKAIRYLFSHARAKVIAQTRHTFTARCPLQTEAVREKETGERRMLQILFWCIPLSFRGTPEGEITAYERKPLVLHGKALPVWVETQRCGIKETETVSFTAEEAQRRAQEKVRALQENYLGEDGVLLSEEITCKEKDGYIYVTAKCVLEEDIAREAAMNGE